MDSLGQLNLSSSDAEAQKSDINTTVAEGKAVENSKLKSYSNRKQASEQVGTHARC